MGSINSHNCRAAQRVPDVTNDPAWAGRCLCAHYGNARLCPYHTQDDYDAAEAAREGQQREAASGAGLIAAERHRQITVEAR